jgi:5-methyltetrahydrofolate--homocysteine methyltransferase
MSQTLEQIGTGVIEGNIQGIAPLVQKALAEGLAAEAILQNGLIVGMNEVGKRFKRAQMFIPEVLRAAKTMHAGQEVLRPLITDARAGRAGKIVIGTVQGDLHDIGKNLVGMMCEGAGFEVVDLGFDLPPEKFTEAIKVHRPDIVGMSALLTTTMRSMGHTLKAMTEAGLRDKVKVMVGGAPVDAEFADRIGADGYGHNAIAGAELAKQLIEAA